MKKIEICSIVDGQFFSKEEIGGPAIARLGQVYFIGESRSHSFDDFKSVFKVSDKMPTSAPEFELKISSKIKTSTQEVWEEVCKIPQPTVCLHIEGVNDFYDKKTLRYVIPMDMTGFIRLDNQKWLYNHYGKYAPNITYLLGDVPAKPNFNPLRKEELNLPKGNLSYVRGHFFKSRKGTKCFRLDEKGPHILVKDTWGGAFNKHRGDELKKLETLYYRRASSNGGGLGSDFAIVKIGTSFVVDEGDI